MYYNLKSLSLMNRLRLFITWAKTEKSGAARSLRDQTCSRNLTCGVANLPTTVHVYLLVTRMISNAVFENTRVAWPSTRDQRRINIVLRGNRVTWKSSKTVVQSQWYVAILYKIQSNYILLKWSLYGPVHL